MELVIFIIDYFEPSAMHFLFSGLAGFIAFCSTQIILFAAFRIIRSRAQIGMGVKYFMLGAGLLLAFIAAFYAHVWLDGFLD